LGWGALLGLAGAIGALVFVIIMNLGISLVWREIPGPEPFSGTWRIPVIMTVAGFLVGLLHRYLDVQDLNVFAGMIKGRLDSKPVPAALLAALISLIGGFSLGPEAPTGMLGGGLANWISERRKLPQETQKTNVMAGVLGAYGELFTAPFFTTLLPVELPHMQAPAYYGTIIIAAVASVIGLAVYYLADGTAFSELLRLLDLPEYTLKVWHLVLAVLFGIIGAALTMVYGLTLRSLKRLVAPLEKKPILRSTLGGLLLGLLGMALPLTLFLGSEGLETVTTGAAVLGAGLLTVYVFAKLLALAGALSMGFIGGPIFPLFFVGGTAGTVIYLLFPSVPMALAVSCMMVAVPSALMLSPLSLAIVVLLIAGVPMTEAAPVLVAALTAFLVVHGLGLAGKRSEGQEHHQDAPPSGDGAPSQEDSASQSGGQGREQAA
jgi:H+/Cl- antiporter ClcA